VKVPHAWSALIPDALTDCTQIQADAAAPLA